MLYPQENTNRRRLNLDGFWDFRAQEEGEAADGWERGLPDPKVLAVPASWNEQREDLFTFFGRGWYQRDVHLPAEWRGRRIWLRIGAAHYRVRAWWNGEELGSYEGGSLPSEFELTEEARPGAGNRLTIEVDARLDPVGLPPAMEAAGKGEERIGFFNQNPPVTYDFFPYGGIHRSVWVYATAANRIESVFVRTSLSGDHTEAVLEVRAAVSDAGSVARLAAEVEGQTADLSREAGTGWWSGRLTVSSPRLWDVGRPEMYEVALTLESVNGEEDTYQQPFGIREVCIGEEGLLLNGRPVYLTGFGKHEDSDFYGRGFNPAVAIRDFELLRWVGANSFRTGHYPYAEEVYDLADRHGVLVIGETPFVGMNERMFTPETEARALPMIERMIARDANHPSVVAWSLANEPYVKSDAALAFFQAMARTARQCDPTRPITYVGHVEVEDNRAMHEYDFICLNKYYGWYIGHGRIDDTLEAFSRKLDEFHKAFQKPMMVTEFGGDAVPGMHAWPAQPFSEEYQAEIVEKQIAVMRSKPYIFGFHLWNFADFKTGQTLTRIILNRKGAFTRDRKPKLVAHVLRRLLRNPPDDGENRDETKDVGRGTP
ncbi:MAG: beta-glucuronidase [Verrucomicrobia bacterium]|jgi:beta-glucuronidase|nr:beta-glucuronidase [Verrucomicrobiota bacterium]